MTQNIEKARWFNVPDSFIEDDEGNAYYNVQAKFADVPILNIAKSRVARHNVYDLGIVLHTKVLRVGDLDQRALKNSTSHVMRFDKGEDERTCTIVTHPVSGKDVEHYTGSTGMGKEAFDAAVRDIMRCWDAWLYYQQFRKAPVTPLEQKALNIIDQRSFLHLGGGAVDIDGELVPLSNFQDKRNIDEDEVEEPLPPPIKVGKKRGPKPRGSVSAV